MKTRIISFLAMAFIAKYSQAAIQTMIWKTDAPFTTNKDYQLTLLSPVNQKNNHKRYQITYRGIPVWGHQLIFHPHSGGVSGIGIQDIEQDLTNMHGALSPEQAEKKILFNTGKQIKFKRHESVIFIDGSQKAHLSYHLTFYTHQANKPISAPNFIIDANSGEILKSWEGARQEKVGQGLGGNAFILPYRDGMFQHGDALPGLPSLGKFDVQIIDGFCHVENEDLRVVNLANQPLGYEAFPISVDDEAIYTLNAFAYPCMASDFYLNYADGGTGPVNYSFSPVNDTMYFAQQTLDMYTQFYGVNRPLGDDLPLRAYTHLGHMDNAFALPTIRDQGLLLAHQQIVIGNGDQFLTAPAQTVIAHELSHNFTLLHSDLIYDGQPGGINEAFSDMAAIALQDFLRRDYPWYWDGKDWTLARESVLGGEPLRYMDDPTRDGMSIGHAGDYKEDLDVHLSSGVFNKAFYLLANKPGWSVQKTFQIMVDANQHYWSPIAYFDFAACGVIQAALDRKYDESAVIEAFGEVGVTCPVKSFFRAKKVDYPDLDKLIS